MKVEIVGVMEDLTILNIVHKYLGEELKKQNSKSVVIELPKNWPKVYRYFKQHFFGILTNRLRRGEIKVFYGGAEFNLIQDLSPLINEENSERYSYHITFGDLLFSGKQHESLEETIRKTDPCIAIVKRKI